MKRSEMLVHIQKILSMNFCDNVEEVSEAILHICEHHGMLPPDRSATVEDLNWAGITQEFIDEHEFTVNVWEVESEDN